MAAETPRIELMGAPGSPYTRKMLATLRYRRIPHTMLWGGHQNPPEGYPAPKVKLLPTFYFRGKDGGIEAAVDSTPITRRLEAMYDGRSVIPSDPVVSFLNDLVEDFADEWLTKAMFHYRWYHEVDRVNAGPILVFWSMPTLSDDDAKMQSDFFTKRQYERLYVVGSNDVTAETIESSYARLVDILDALIARRGYVLGARPASADFALYGQLTQLAIVEPTPAALTRAHSARVRSWIDRVDDLSGVEPSDGDWYGADEAGDALKPLLTEIGRVYAPFLLANAKAVASGQENFETEIDGRAWTQPTFPYQAKCLQWLREAREDLPADARTRADKILAGTGCEAMFA